MVNHVCVRCGYTTNRKQNLKNHLLRKFICEPINEDIDRYNLLVMNNFDQEAKKFKSHSKSNPKLMFKCKFCSKIYKYKQGKYKHEQKCKYIFNIETNKEKDKDNIISELQNNNKILEDELAELKKTVEQLILNQGKNMVQPKLNNGTINNVGKVKNMNIQINNYGCENIDYITDKVFKKLLNTPMSAIQKLIE
jgi:hypothetical protein